MISYRLDQTQSVNQKNLNTIPSSDLVLAMKAMFCEKGLQWRLFNILMAPFVVKLLQWLNMSFTLNQIHAGLESVMLLLNRCLLNVRVTTASRKSIQQS